MCGLDGSKERLVMKCVDCQYFHIRYEPMMPYDMGLAACDRYCLEVDFSNKRKLNRLVCVKDEEKDNESGNKNN